MREIVFKLTENGATIKRVSSITFDFEDNATEVVLETGYDSEYMRCEIMIPDGTVAVEFGKRFMLTNDMLKEGQLFFQPVYQFQDVIKKWQPVSIKVEPSLNVIEDDRSVTESVATLIIEDISNFKDEIKKKIVELIDLKTEGLKGKDGKDGAVGSQGPKGDKGDTPIISFRINHKGELLYKVE